MMAFMHRAARSKHVRRAYKAHAFVSGYRASGVLGHAVNFARGVLIGGIVVLLFWHMVG
jgi:hypothetical protein